MVESAKGVWAPDLYFDEPRKTFMIAYTRMARMLAEGGTGSGHSVRLSRSKNIWSPYEKRNDFPLVTSHSKNFNDYNNNLDSLKLKQYKEN